MVLEAVTIGAAIASGVSLALLNLVLGNFITLLTDYVSNNSTKDDFMSGVTTYCLYFVYIGVARLVLTYLYTVFSTCCAYNIVRNIRRAYFRAALSQEIGFFDLGSGGSISSRFNSGSTPFCFEFLLHFTYKGSCRFGAL